MLRRDVLKGMAAATAATAVGTRGAAAQDVIKIGACLSLVGGFQTVGRQALAGAKLYMQLNGDRVAGKKIELIVRDDTGVPDVARRIVQEMIVNDKVNIVLGGITPTALVARPAGHPGEDPDRGDHLGRLDHGRPLALHDAHQLHARPVVGDHGRMGGEERQQAGRHAGERLGARRRGRDRVRRTPSRPAADRSSRSSRCRSPTRISRRSCSASATSGRTRRSSISPASRAASSRASSSSAGSTRPTSRSSARATSPTTTSCPAMGDVMLGMITAHHYSAAHPSATNKAYVEAFKKANNFRPNFISIGGWDGMHLIYEALKKTNGSTEGDAMMARHEGHEVGKPARPDLDRSGDARHRAEHLHAQGREGGRRAATMWSSRPSRP